MNLLLRYVNESCFLQIFPPGTRERPAEPPQAATPGAAGADRGAFVHPPRLPQRAPLAEPICAGADQWAAGAVWEQDHGHNNDAAKEPTAWMWLCVGRRLNGCEAEMWELSYFSSQKHCTRMSSVKKTWGKTRCLKAYEGSHGSGVLKVFSVIKLINRPKCDTFFFFFATNRRAE